MDPPLVVHHTTTTSLPTVSSFGKLLPADRLRSLSNHEILALDHLDGKRRQLPPKDCSYPAIWSDGHELCLSCVLLERLRGWFLPAQVLVDGRTHGPDRVIDVEDVAERISGDVANGVHTRHRPAEGELVLGADVAALGEPM